MTTSKTLVSILMFVSVLLSACTSAATSIPTAVPVTPTAIPAMPTTIPPTGVPTSAQTTISPKTFKIPMSVTFGPDWYYVNVYSPQAFTLQYRPANLLIDFLIVDNVTVTLFASGDPPAHFPFPDDFAGYLKSSDYFSDITPKIPISLGGAEGYQVDAVGSHSAPIKTPFFSFNDNNFKEFVNTEPQKFRFIYFDGISGKQLLIVIGSDNGSGVSPLTIDQFDALMPKVQEVLDTVTFNK
jgi:hypothetical protein